MDFVDFKYLTQTQSEFKLKVALQLKRLRVKKSISQDQFYQETNINIARLETGKYDTRMETVRKICYYFDISISEFFKDIH